MKRQARSDAPRVLVIENRPALADQIQQVLSDEAYSTFLVRDALEVLDEASRLDPQVVIVELSLPVLDAFEFLSRLRGLPVVALSQSRTLLRQAMDFGASALVQTPLRAEALLDGVAAALRGEEVRFYESAEIPGMMSPRQCSLDSALLDHLGMLLQAEIGRLADLGQPSALEDPRNALAVVADELSDPWVISDLTRHPLARHSYWARTAGMRFYAAIPIGKGRVVELVGRKPRSLIHSEWHLLEELARCGLRGTST